MRVALKRTMGKTALIGLGLLIGAGGAAVASHTVLNSSPDTIQACISPGRGLLRYSTTGHCYPRETPLAWNIQGPSGPAGVGRTMLGDGVVPVTRVNIGTLGEATFGALDYTPLFAVPGIGAIDVACSGDGHNRAALIISFRNQTATELHFIPVAARFEPTQLSSPPEMHARVIAPGGRTSILLIDPGEPSVSWRVASTATAALITLASTDRYLNQIIDSDLNGVDVPQGPCHFTAQVTYLGDVDPSPLPPG